MFPGLSVEIGKDNALVVKKKLEEEGIKIVVESIGGSCGMSVELSTTTGIVTIRTRI